MGVSSQKPCQAFSADAWKLFFDSELLERADVRSRLLRGLKLPGSLGQGSKRFMKEANRFVSLLLRFWAWQAWIRGQVCNDGRFMSGIMPSTKPARKTVNGYSPDRSRRFQAPYASAHWALSRLTTDGDRPLASAPSSTDRASCISPVEIPRRYNHGKAASTRWALRTYGGTTAELNLTPLLERSRTLGIRTVTGPSPVRISRSGK